MASEPVLQETQASRETGRSARQRWMAVLARAKRVELKAIVERLGGLPAHTVLKGPEAGTIMIEARAGGTGRRFNLGEATMTRCVVRLEGGGNSAATMGFSYALGTDRQKALLAAVLDALLQRAEPQSDVLAKEVAQLAAEQAARRDLASRKAARTRVDFFALVRGHA
jgi:alpha-D-ribose 1-methylphosphonate 5-triphosphate synthase subunit PhnG